MPKLFSVYLWRLVSSVVAALACALQGDVMLIVILGEFFVQVICVIAFDSTEGAFCCKSCYDV